MGYTPTNWNTGDVVTAQKLNKIENALNNDFSINPTGCGIFKAFFDDNDNTKINTEICLETDRGVIVEISFDDIDFSCNASPSEVSNKWNMGQPIWGVLNETMAFPLRICYQSGLFIFDFQSPIFPLTPLGLDDYAGIIYLAYDSEKVKYDVSLIKWVIS